MKSPPHRTISIPYSLLVDAIIVIALHNHDNVPLTEETLDDLREQLYAVDSEYARAIGGELYNFVEEAINDRSSSD